MKKMMIAFAAMAFAVVANAASMNWSLSYSYESGASTDDGPFANGWLVAIFDAGVTETSSAAAITSLIQAGAADAVGKAVSTATTDGDGAASRFNVTFSGNAGDTVTAYLVLFDAASAGGASNFVISDAVSAVAPTSGASGALDFDDFVASAVPGNWTATSAVPEPTSGLLLLLGMAGLALKRKQA